MQFVVSGANFSMNFLLLTIQSTVCVLCVLAVKQAGVITFRDFDMQDAKKWFPISLLLVSVIYTGSKSIVRCFLAKGSEASNGCIAIFEYPRIHDLQELNDYINCGSS